MWILTFGYSKFCDNLTHPIDYGRSVARKMNEMCYMN